MHKAAIRANKMGLPWIELKQTSDRVIYRWVPIFKIVLLDSITAVTVVELVD